MNKTLPSFSSLTGQILIAMPNMDDDRFVKSVIYVCSHTEDEGAMGVVVNFPAQHLTLDEVLAQLNIKPMLELDQPILLGGPDQMTRGFILHSDDYMSLSTCSVKNEMALTATQDILRDIANDIGPSRYLIALGCATWVRGQLEEEIMANIWLTATPTKQLIFQTPPSEQWDESLALLNIRPEFLSGDAGKA